MSRIVIFANGVPPELESLRAVIKPADWILCADGGTRHALALGLRPDLIIGDLDSLEEDEKARVQSGGIPTLPHPRDKNETDLELALNYAVEQGPSSIVIVAALGRRLDQTLGNIAMLSNPSLASLDVRLDDGLEEVYFCRVRARIDGATGDVVSLIPWGVAVDGIVTEGLKWPLHGETLYPDKTRGISNEMVGRAADVSLSAGLLLIVHRRGASAEDDKTKV